MAHTDRKDACNRKLHPDIRDAHPMRRFDCEGRDMHDAGTFDIEAFIRRQEDADRTAKGA